jgi:hypothetical protein
MIEILQIAYMYLYVIDVMNRFGFVKHDLKGVLEYKRIDMAKTASQTVTDTFSMLLLPFTV